MNYQSTRNKSLKVSSAQAILQGISVEGGLFVPESFPDISRDLQSLCGMSYPERAEFILGKYLTDFSNDELNDCVNNAYTAEKFGSRNIAPLKSLDGNTHVLELWHGPTCAFKDMALQLLPHLLVASARKAADGKSIVILVATSGDTGKAALEGFKNVENTKILVFYPQHGVSGIQKLQMNTQEGSNVAVCGIDGNFDDAQTAVKQIFTDKALRDELARENMMFSSANSINWGRLVPQIVYYVSVYCELVNQKKIVVGDSINIVVPTGNFGNILAAYYAKKMGLPVKKFICASNKNKVLTDFINTGVYDREREFFATSSPSMDILISSNLERLLFDLSDCDDNAVRELMGKLSGDGCYTVNDDIKSKLNEMFFGGFCDENGTKETIKTYFERHGYLCDTHTAVALNAYEQYIALTGDKTPSVIASTASPYKFADSVLSALSGEVSGDEFKNIETLFELSNLPVPVQISALDSMNIRFDNNCTKDTIKDFVCGNIK